MASFLEHRKTDKKSEPLARRIRPKVKQLPLYEDRVPIPELNFPGTREKAIEQMRGMIITEAKRKIHRAKKHGLTMEDLIHFGSVGAFEAYARFEPEKKVKFQTYAGWWITAEIERCMQKETYLIINPNISADYESAVKSLNAYLANNRSSLNKYENKLYDRLDSGKVSVDSALRKLALRKAYIMNATNPISLNAPVKTFGEASFCYLDMVKAPQETHELIDFVRLRERIYDRLESAAKRLWGGSSEQNIKMRRRAGVLFRERITKQRGDAATLVELGERFGVSRERVRQMEIRLRKELAVVCSQDPVIKEFAKDYGIDLERISRDVRDSKKQN